MEDKFEFIRFILEHNLHAGYTTIEQIDPSCVKEINIIIYDTTLPITLINSAILDNVFR